MKYMYHFTRDGEYVDGVSVSISMTGDNNFLQKLAYTYSGCHVWVAIDANAPAWMQMVAVALPYEGWRPEDAKSVPECVRTAEYLRDK